MSDRGSHPAVADDQLDELARALPPHTRSPGRVEQTRNRLLAAAEAAPPARGRRRAIVATTAAVCAAAAAAWWLVVRTGDPRSPALARDPADATVAAVDVTASAEAEWTRTDGDDEDVVVVARGTVAVSAPRDRHVRVTAPDAEVSARGARFSAEVDGGRLVRVVVHEGRVEIAAASAPAAVVISAGDVWVPPASEVDPETAGAPVEPAPTARMREPDPAPSPRRGAVASTPGELAFRDGWAALQAGQPARATRELARACASARDAALGEDACFWLGVAARRAGQPARARRALTEFVSRYPRSPRVNEASALLGWLLVDAGELDAAEGHFHRAAGDPNPTVRDSAAEGLRAIARARDAEGMR